MNAAYIVDAPPALPALRIADPYLIAKFGAKPQRVMFASAACSRHAPRITAAACCLCTAPTAKIQPAATPKLVGRWTH